MLAFMKDIKDSDLDALLKPEDLKKAKEIFTEIVTMINFMGSFFAKLLLFINTGSTSAMSKSDFHTLSLLMSTMLVPHYIFERYSFFLAKILTIQDQREWFEWRREKVKCKSTSNDLIFLKKFIGVEEKRNLIRKNTIRRMSSARFVQKREIGFHQVNGIKMDMNEFLSHLQLQVNLELDEVFTTDLNSIIEYFKSLDEFVNKTFYNAELEIKIDLMRLILRMTTATKFVTYIYVLSNMKVEFLDECQIFALFCQVMLVELKKPSQEKTERKETHDNSKCYTTVPGRTRLHSGNYLEPKDSCGRDNMILYEPNNKSIGKRTILPAHLNLSGSGIYKNNDSIDNDSSFRDASYADGLRSPVSIRTGRPPTSVFKPIIIQLDNTSLRSSKIREESSEIDLDQDSGDLSESSPRRNEQDLNSFKIRNSCSPQPRMLKRLSHVNPLGSMVSNGSQKTIVTNKDEDDMLEEVPEVALFEY